MPLSSNRFPFTLKSLKALEPGDKPRLFYDDSCPGLGVRISPKGKQSFFHQAGTKRTTLKTHVLDIARKQVRARQSTEEIESDVDGWTLGKLFDNWMQLKSKPKKRTWKRDESRWRQYFEPWENRRISKISKADVIGLHNSIHQANGPYAANDTVIFLKSLYNFARRTFDWYGRNPAEGLEMFPEQERERYLTAEEFPRWHAAVMQLRGSESRDFFLLALWTGVRRETVLSMRWDELELSDGKWNIPPEKSKNKRGQTLWLSDAAMEILATRKEVSKSEWVLPSPRGASSGHYADPKAAWAKVLKLSGITNLRVHDLRRTLGSWMAEGGTSLHVIGKVLGHQTQQATRIYARLADGAVRDAANAAANAMQSTLSQSEKPQE